MISQVNAEDEQQRQNDFRPGQQQLLKMIQALEQKLNARDRRLHGMFGGGGLGTGGGSLGLPEVW
jgi:hypothetical protein